MGILAQAFWRNQISRLSEVKKGEKLTLTGTRDRLFGEFRREGYTERLWDRVDLVIEEAAVRILREGAFVAFFLWVLNGD